MDIFYVTIKIGIRIETHEIRAKTMNEAIKKSYDIIGDQSGEIVFIDR